MGHGDMPRRLENCQGADERDIGARVFSLDIRRYLCIHWLGHPKKFDPGGGPWNLAVLALPRHALWWGHASTIWLLQRPAWFAIVAIIAPMFQRVVASMHQHEERMVRINQGKDPEVIRG